MCGEIENSRRDRMTACRYAACRIAAAR